MSKIFTGILIFSSVLAGPLGNVIASKVSNWRGCMPFTKLEAIKFCFPVGLALVVSGFFLFRFCNPFFWMAPFGLFVVNVPLLSWTWYDPKKATWERQTADKAE